MLIEHEALKELDDVHELIDWSRIESLLAGLHSNLNTYLDLVLTLKNKFG